MSTPVSASPATLRVLALAALAGAVLGIPLIAAGTHLVPGYAARDVVLAVGFVLAVAAVVLAVLGLVLSTRTAAFIAALAVTVGWIVLGVVLVAVGTVDAREQPAQPPLAMRCACESSA